jgi:uncharacterized protein (DUF362 family)
MKFWKSLDELLEDQELTSFIQKFKIIYVKPNFCTIAKSPATTPLNSIVKITRKINELNRKAIVIETDQLTSTAEIRAEKLGLITTDIPFYNVTNVKTASEITSLQINHNKEVRIFTGETDAGFINLPLIKATDTGPQLSCATKNLFGLVCEKNKAKLHKYLHDILNEFSRIYKDKVFTVVDGTQGMEGKGSPTNGKKVTFNPQFWISGLDFIEIDSMLEKKFFPTSSFYRSMLKSPPSVKITNIDLLNENRSLKSTSLNLYKRVYYWAWQNLDRPWFKPIMRWREEKWKKYEMIQTYDQE